VPSVHIVAADDLFCRAVLACGVMLSSAVHQPTELMYEHKSSWGGFLERNHRAAANNLSIRDVNLLKIAEKDIKKQHKAAVKTETTVSLPYLFLQTHAHLYYTRTSTLAVCLQEYSGKTAATQLTRGMCLQDKAAYKQEKLSEKLALLKKQKAKAKKAAVQAAIAKATSKAEPKGLNLSKRDEHLLEIATKQIKKHHAQELAEETRDDDAEKVAKNKARAAYLVYEMRFFCEHACVYKMHKTVV